MSLLSALVAHIRQRAIAAPSISVLALLAFAPGLAGQGITAEQVADLEQVTATAIDPAGARIAFTVTRPRSEDEPLGSARSELWLVGSAGGEPRPVIRRLAGATSPAWTPDSRTLAFLAALDGDAKGRQVHGYRVEDGSLGALTGSPTDIAAFAVSPDGRWVAYTAADEESAEAIERRGRGYDAIVWGEDERHLRLWVERVGTGERRALTPDDRTIRDFAWAPDSRRLALQVTETTDADADLMFRRLYTVALDGEAMRPLTETDGKLGPMAWSPDGSSLAFLGAVSRKDPLPQSVFVVSADGGEAVNRTPGFEGSAEWIGWADSNHVLFAAVESTRTTLNRVPARRGDIQRIAGGGEEVFRSVSLDGRARRFAVAANTASHPGEVFVGTVGRAELTRLTRHNAFLDDVRLGRQETIAWTGADGLRIEGVLVHPVDPRPGERHPLVVLPHGGPEGVSVDGWVTRALYPVQLLAARGYYVLKPNYRASGGRGVAFAKANHRDAGGKEFDDVLLGIDHLVAEGLVDRDRVGISGTSYGGYFAAWAATRHSDRFAAAISFAGISNWLSLVGTTDIPFEMTLVHWDLWWYDNPGFYWDRSPIAHLHRARTPTLVGHGLVDDRVDPEQSLQLAQALRLMDVPVSLVLYPREPHALNERAHQIDFILRAADWFDHYLASDAEALTAARTPAGRDESSPPR